MFTQLFELSDRFFEFFLQVHNLFVLLGYVIIQKGKMLFKLLDFGRKGIFFLFFWHTSKLSSVRIQAI